MDKEIFLEGNWWLPSKPDQKLSGKLKYEPYEGSNLELHGSFHKSHDFVPYEIILGKSNKQEEVTLFHCTQTRQTGLSSETFQDSYSIENSFIGANFNNLEEILFKDLYIELNGLNEWLSYSNFDIKRDEEKLTVNFKYSKPIDFYTGEDFSIELFIGGKESYQRSKITIEQQVSFKVIAQKNFNFNRSVKSIRLLSDFLSFAMAQPCYPIKLTAKLQTKDKNDQKEKRAHFVNIIAPYKFMRTLKPTSRADILFVYKDVEDSTQNLFGNWLKNKELLESIYDLYLGLIYNPEAYLEQKFLFAIQAVEAYHRRKMNNQVLPEEEHKKRKKEILDLITNKDYKNWLSGRLAYSNEPGLKKRLNELSSRFQGSIGKLLNQNVIDLIYCSRNYYTHYDQKLKDKVATGVRLSILKITLKLLIEACLLSELGIDEQQLNKIFANNLEFNSVKNNMGLFN